MVKFRAHFKLHQLFFTNGKESSHKICPCLSPLPRRVKQTHSVVKLFIDVSISYKALLALTEKSHVAM